MEEMTALLTRYNLQQYADAFEAKGYDDVRYIFTCAARADADVLLGQVAADTQMKPGHSSKFAHYLRAHAPADDGAPPPWKVLYLPDGLQPTAPMAGGASGSVSGKRDGYQSGPRMTQCAASTPSDALRADATLMAVWEMTTAVMRAREARREWVHGWLIEHKARPTEPSAPYHGDLYVTPPEVVTKIEASAKRKREVTGGHNSSLRSRSALLSVLERRARGEWWEQPAKGAMVEVEVNDEENETVCWRAARVIDVQVDGRFKVHVQEADGEYDHDEPFIECFSPEQEGVEWRRALLIGSTEPRSQDVV